MAASAADAGIHKKILGSENATTLIIPNDEIEDIMGNSMVTELHFSEIFKEN